MEMKGYGWLINIRILDSVCGQLVRILKQGRNDCLIKETKIRFVEKKLVQRRSRKEMNGWCRYHRFSLWTTR